MKALISFNIRKFYLLLMLLPVTGILFLISCNNQNKQKAEESETTESFVKHPDWSKNANIYEVNIRQYTKEGTFKAFEKHLPRLKEMGVDILWLMPIFPIGEKNRKGTMGSYYAVKDYMAVNPEFGTMEDFKDLVKKAHDMGFKVILDWVANHTAWDNQMIYEHPDWYTEDSTGKMVSPYDWTDVADLNYDSQGLRDYMMEALKFWVEQADIDGYRCDVAGMVPTDFWDRAREQLDNIKPVFMLAEAEQVDHHEKAFDMSYAWELHHIMNQIAKGEKNANDIEIYMEKQDTLYPANAYRMIFITNHDENSWNGTVNERMGEGAKAFAVLTYTLPGMPLIYSGQEVGLDKRLEFFEKDEIDWDFDSSLVKFYTNLNHLKSENKALWNGEYGGELKRIKTSDDESVFAFIREKEGNQIFVITNLTDKPVSVTLFGKDYSGIYIDVFSGEEKIFGNNAELEIKPWGFLTSKRFA